MQKVCEMLSDTGPLLFKLCFFTLRSAQAIMLFDIEHIQQRAYNKNDAAAELYRQQTAIKLGQNQYRQRICYRYSDRYNIVYILSLICRNQCEICKPAHIFCKGGHTDNKNKEENICSRKNRNMRKLRIQQADRYTVSCESNGYITKNLFTA